MPAPRTITVATDERGVWSVSENGATTGPLCWEEVLGQIVTLTHPAITAPRFPMRTADEWASDQQRRDSQREANRVRAETEERTALGTLAEVVQAFNSTGAHGASFLHLIRKADKLIHPL